MSFIGQFELPGATAHYNPNRPGDVTHIALNLNFDIENESFTGTSHLTINPVRSGINQIEVHACEMDIVGISLESQNLEYGYDGRLIQIQLPKPTTSDSPFTLKIDYSVTKPKLGITFVKPNRHYPDKPVQVWSQGESEQSRYWYPCLDYPTQICTSEITVTVPKGLMAISNGSLIKTTHQDDTSTYHWHQQKPHPNYLIALTIGDFSEIKDSWNGIPVNYYAQKGKEEELRLSGGKTPKMIEFYSSIFGVPYPWQKYHQVWISDFTWGGMENTSMTINTDKALADKKAYKDFNFSEVLVAHELTHQWFGDLVVINHWSHLWVKEGAATYGESLWWEHEYGQDEFQYYRYLEIQEYLAEGNNVYTRPTVTNIYRDVEDLYDRHSYTKAGCVYHMLRAHLKEDELFTKSLKTFISDNLHKNVEGKDLAKAIEKSTGINVLPILDQYIFRAGHPDLKVAYQWDNEFSLAKVTITQKQAKDDDDKDKLFTLTLPISFYYVSKNKVKFSKDYQITISKKEQSFYFPLEKKPDFVALDPQNNILKDLQLEIGLKELQAQAQFDPNVALRIYATQALAKKGSLEAVKTISKILTQDPFWGVRLEAATSLTSIQLDQASQALEKGLQDDDSRVRKACIQALSKNKTEKNFKIIYKIAKNGNPDSYFTESSALHAIGDIATLLGQEYEQQVIELASEVLQTRSGWNEVVRGGAIAGLSKLKANPKAFAILLEYTKLGIPMSLRLQAISLLGTISAGQERKLIDKAIQTLQECAKDDYINSERAVIMAASDFKDRQVLPILAYIKEKTIYGRIKRMAQDALTKVRANIGPEKTVEELAKEFENLKQENRTLKSRVEELEAKSKKSLTR